MASRIRTHGVRWEGSKAAMQQLARAAQRRAQKNPIDELRKPWKLKPGEQRTFDASWNLCLHHVGSQNLDPNPAVIEVLTAGEGEPAEVVVYIVEVLRFPELEPDASLEATFTRDPAKPWEASPNYIEWVKETATRVFRGQAEDNEMFCVKHRPSSRADVENELCTHNCTLTDDAHAGWRGLLWSFLNQTSYFDNMDWRTPVVIDRDYVTDLNHASLVTAELRNLHSKLSDAALGQRDYYENNGDCVDEVSNVYVKEIVSAVLDNQYFIAVNEEGTTREGMPQGPGIAVAAEAKWREEVVERLADLENEGPFYARKFNQSSAEAKIREDFEKWLRSEVKHATMFNRAEWDALTEEPATPDPRGGTKRGAFKLNDKWLKVCTWEQSSVEDQLSEDIVEEVAAYVEGGGDTADLERALGRQGITWTDDDLVQVDCDCFWVFAIDVNDAIEKVNDLIAEWKVEDE